MLLYSTNNPSLRVSLQDAVLQGMPADNGLFMPERIPTLPRAFFDGLPAYSFAELSFEIARTMLAGAVAENDLRGIVERAINFPAPLVRLDGRTFVLELFHGPSLAFKDFGARFMAELMSYFLRGEERELVILVATSGDTGGAVAAGFHRVPGIRVVVLYPSGQVSPLQEKQFAALGDNITAVEVAGTFDDCQALVKSAFLDAGLRGSSIRLSTANSINIARLIPQIFYYFEAYKQLPPGSAAPVFSVPSGNFGNLTAGLLAKRLGLPVGHFLAATNLNDVVPEYLEHGVFRPRPSQTTLSSAMDVGNPSNFARMLDLHGSTWNMLRQGVRGFRYSDDETRETMRAVETKHNYILDPHGAVAYRAWEDFQAEAGQAPGIILETAHPAKFLESVTAILGHDLPLPVALQALQDREKKSVPLPTDFMHFRQWLLDTHAA